MKVIMFTAAILFSSSAIASAHGYRVHEAPAYSAISHVNSWQFALPQQRNAQDAYSNDRGTMTGGPSGGPNQS